MNKILPINKPVGITSYDVVRELKKKYPGETIGHAGTLDPLAEGLLICLVGKDATARQGEFMNLEKDYEFEVLFGFSTDTYDILGLVEKIVDYDVDKVLDAVEANIGKFTGTISQKVPPFSAVKVKGKPLYRWYLQGKINEVKIPVKEVEIKSISIKEDRIVSHEELLEDILGLISCVKKGFRNSEVSQSWLKVLGEAKQNKFLVVTLKATVSKGTYVRAIAHDLGQRLGVGACTMRIARTRIGDFKLSPK